MTENIMSDGSGKKARVKDWKKSKGKAGGTKRKPGDAAKALAKKFPKKDDDPF